MDGKGRCLDNVFVERLWRSLKYEEVYPARLRRRREARAGIGRYFGFYNDERPHQALGYQTPAAFYAGQVEEGGVMRLHSLLPNLPVSPSRSPSRASHRARGLHGREGPSGDAEETTMTYLQYTEDERHAGSTLAASLHGPKKGVHLTPLNAEPHGDASAGGGLVRCRAAR